MLQHGSTLQSQTFSRPRFSVGLAQNKWDVQAAQRLRYQVFAEEMGAKLSSAHVELDEDDYDAVCDHLIVRDEMSGQVVGTYRLLPPHRAQQLPQLYSEQEFDLSGLAPIRHHLIEIGRSCVHKDFRSGAVITLLWSGLAEYLLNSGHEYLIGCASVSLADNAAQVIAVQQHLHQNPAQQASGWGICPYQPLVLSSFDTADQLPTLPPLIKGYLRAGAKIVPEPAWDSDFNCADFFVIWSRQHISQRYGRHFLAQAA